MLQVFSNIEQEKNYNLTLKYSHKESRVVAVGWWNKQYQWDDIK